MHTRRVLAPGLALFVTAFGVSSCASLVRQPDVRLIEVGLAGIGLTGATARVTLLVTNPNRFALDGKALDYRFAFLPPELQAGEQDEPGDEDWRTLATGLTTEPVHVPARDSAAVTVDIPFGYEELGQALGGLLRDGRLRYRFHGALTVGSPVGDLRLPFDRTGLLDP